MSFPDCDASNGDQEFARQCAEVGLLVCRLDGHRLVLPWPGPDGYLQTWIGSGAFAERLTKAMGANQDSVDLVEGLWVIRVPEASPWLLLLPTPEGLRGAAFEQLCSRAQLKPEAVTKALIPFLKYTAFQREQAIATFSRFHRSAGSAEQDQALIGQFSHQLSQAYEELNLFFRLAKLLNTGEDPVRTVSTICEELQKNLAFGWVGACFFDDGASLPALRGKTLSAGALPCPESSVSDSIAAFRGSAVGEWTRIHNPSQSLLADAAGGQVIAQLLKDGEKEIGLLLAGGKSGEDAEVTSEELQLAESAANFISIFCENAARLAEQRLLFLGTVRALAASIDAKDRYTRGHSERVSSLGASLARALGIDSEMVEQYRIAGLLHDVGKIGIPEAILTKSSRLTEDEFRQIMKHPRMGYDILKDIPGIAFALPGVLHHHEKFDGTGYPEKLAGEQIPLIARVLALADTFDAMRSNRAYRTSRPHDVVIQEILRCAGTQFDPALAPVFAQLDFSEFERLLAADAGRALAA